MRKPQICRVRKVGAIGKIVNLGAKLRVDPLGDRESLAHGEISWKRFDP